MLERNGIELHNFFLSSSTPYGLTYGQWTVMWWNWFLSTPKQVNPVLDETGRFSSVNQPDRHVWFLAGKVADENKALPNRYCKIPYGRSILFPIINCEANALEYPQLTTEHDIIDHVDRDENTILIKECFLDGSRIPAQRVKSDPPMFEVKINKNNPCYVRQYGITRASGDGFWVFLKPLPRGSHFISFRGSCEMGKLNSGANYRLEVS